MHNNVGIMGRTFRVRIMGNIYRVNVITADMFNNSSRGYDYRYVYTVKKDAGERSSNLYMIPKQSSTMV